MSVGYVMRNGRRIEVETLDPNDSPIKGTSSTAATRGKAPKRKNFAIVPLNDDWGYRAVTVSGRGAAIVLYVLREQRARDGDGIPITAAVLRRFGIDRKVRTSTINRLVAAGFATVRRRGKYRGCPLLTLKIPTDE